MTQIVPEPILDIFHHKIHEGHAYQAFNIDQVVTIANPKTFLFTTPIINEIIHLRYNILPSPGAILRIYEDSVATGGTPLNIKNLNRISTNTSGLIISFAPTVTTLGNIIYEEIAGTNVKNTVDGAFKRHEDEIILKLNTKYIFRITPLLDPAYVSANFKWYEINIT